MKKTKQRFNIGTAVKHPVFGIGTVVATKELIDIKVVRLRGLYDNIIAVEFDESHEQLHSCDGLTPLCKGRFIIGPEFNLLTCNYSMYDELYEMFKA